MMKMMMIMIIIIIIIIIIITPWSRVLPEKLTGFAAKTKLNSVALVRERTIPTERPPPVGEVSANFCG
jgi:prepilin signal peptidase PulO-like enzyme (type II secretory pathway)